MVLLPIPKRKRKWKKRHIRACQKESE
jgi:hypothetical protein